MISKQTVSHGWAEDVLYRPYVQSGQYLVKLGQYFLKSETRCIGNQAQPAHTKNLWKSIWKLSPPSKKKKKTSYGEQAVMHCLPWKIWFVAASLKIQLVPTAQNKPKMCCMYFGSAQVYLQSGMMTLNGILGIQ